MLVELITKKIEVADETGDAYVSEFKTPHVSITDAHGNKSFLSPQGARALHGALASIIMSLPPEQGDK